MQRNETRPISLSASVDAASSRCSPLTSSRYCRDCTVRPHRPGAVLEQVAAALGQRGALVHPAHRRLDVVRHRRPVVGPAEHVAPRHRDVVLKRDHHRHRREGLGHLAVGGYDGGDARRRPRGQDEQLVPGPQHAAGHRPGVAAEVRALGRLAPDDVLHREAGVDEVLVAADVDRLEVVEQRGPVVPPHVLGALHDVVASQRRDRDERDVVHVQPGGELHEVGLDLLVAVLVPVDQVHLVDADAPCGGRPAWRTGRRAAGSARSRPCGRRSG